MSEYITREQAAAQGALIYRTVPCKHGHDEGRYTKSGTCVVCAKCNAKRFNKNAAPGYRYKFLKRHIQRVKDTNPSYYCWKNACGSAAKRGLEITITPDDLHVPDVCPVLGIPLSFQIGKRTDNSPSVDRIDSSKGYVPGNCIVISWRANSLKKDATLDELKRLVAYMEK